MCTRSERTRCTRGKPTKDADGMGSIDFEYTKSDVEGRAYLVCSRCLLYGHYHFHRKQVTHPPVPPAQPPRETHMNYVEPGKIQSGKRKNRAVMLHALVNIEQWGIDLAWDSIARFGPMHKDLPLAFFSDFSKVALDKGKHFSLLRARLDSLSTPYGSLPVHASLWESASHTSASLLFRLAIIFASVGSGRTFFGGNFIGFDGKSFRNSGSILFCEPFSRKRTISRP
ncbi:DUF455-domain-containing protein [Gymnopus androsaceus JB14]|uniref:DUF455-domain-containing protein n=1 Tax=Gymnopus androsaceus JB14 TaxID=1447944 RepID=A0A6A4GQY6_9AGAR|nr:DUF455-domain-containing protein [Gymnopus androsaceus JB14]